MPTKPRLALVSTYAHLTRDSVERMLAEAFPEFEIDNFSVPEVVKRHRAWIAPNLLYAVKEYRQAMLQGRATLREAYLTTTYVFKKLHAAMRGLIDPGRHLFSFQTQSLYDTSVPGVPHFIYTDHTHLSNLHYPDFDRSALRCPAWLALERTIYQNAAAVFTRSTDIAADLTRFYDIGADKVECVYAGSNVDIPKSTVRANDGYTNQRIFFVGIDWERKGGPELVEAFRKVLNAHPRAHLTIAGSSVPLDLPNCTVLGRVTPDQLAHHYAHASVFCLPTKREPFGIAFVEAMMNALPIVGTRVGAVPDMVEDGVNGYLVEPGQADTLAEALCKLLADPQQCAKMGERSYERALERYNWARVGERIRARVMRIVGGTQESQRLRAVSM